MALVDKKRVGMNVSLTPELARSIQERVESGLYSSASEVVREALRLLLAKDRSAEPAVGSAQAKSEFPDLVASDWRELREALLSGEASLMDERAGEIAELFEAGLALARTRIAAEHPGATEATIHKHLAQWLRERAGADFGDGPGEPVSEECLRRILGE